MAKVTIYTTAYCGDCRRTKQFLKDRGIEFQEVDLDGAPEAEELVIKMNEGKRRVPTLEVDGRFFSCSPFDPYLLAEELKIPLNS